MHPYFGDIALETTHDFKFNTAVSGMPTTLAGSPVISAYVGNGTTEITAGITLTVDIDGRVGLHNIRVVATSGNGFATATDVDLVVTVGTVGGSSVVPMIAASFSIEHRSSGASSAPTAVEIRTEMDANSERLSDILDITSDTHVRAKGLTFDSIVIGPTGNDATHLHLQGLAYAANDIKSMLLSIEDVSTGLKYSSWILAFDATSGLATVAALPFTPEPSVDVIWLMSARADIPWNAAWDAEVESEVNDAINTAIAELGVAAPTATPTLRTGMMLMYMALRNKLVVQTSGTDAIELYNDAGTKIASKAITDDGSDYQEAEMT